MEKPPEGTMCLPNPDARASVIQSLQATASRNNPGSYEYELADRAVELALSPGRVADNPAFLTRNVKRDAARFLQNQQDPEVFLSSLEAGLKKKAIGDVEPPSVESVLPPAKTPEPVDELAAAELEDLVRTAVKGRPIGEDCLDAMLANEQPPEKMKVRS
ncbi:MAG: hypothetical protein IT429_15460 [Gemmataceae bacterium]|nr:hypothetical protein [Gemmataceae bacterium]